MICDLVCDGDPLAVEVKMARPNGDNGKPDDTSIKDVLSPYESDRSAVSDCIKLARYAFEGKRAILIYGFEDIHGRRPLEGIIEAFEILAEAKLKNVRASLGDRVFAAVSGLVHPVHQSGGVFSWEIKSGIPSGMRRARA